jgi:hypothetical protein
LEDVEFTSDSDYCDSSEKRRAKKRKSKKRETKKNPKSKRNKTSKLTKNKNVASNETINHTDSTNISFKGNDNSITELLDVTPINTESLNSMNINRITEESRVNKYLKKSIKDPTVFNNTLNDCLSSKKGDSVNNNGHSNVVIIKPLLPIKSEMPQNSSLINLTTHIKSKNQPYMPTVFLTPTIEIIDIKSTRKLYQPTLEPIQIKDEEEYVIDGMFQFFFY